MGKVAVAVVLMMAAVAYGQKAHVTCDRSGYNKIGCFAEDNANMVLLINDRVLKDADAKHQDGYLLNWQNFGASIHSLACRCSAAAKEGQYAYFAIRYWAECWASKDASMVAEVTKQVVGDDVNGRRVQANNCANDKFGECDDSVDGECVGRAFHEYIYTLTAAAPDAIDGGWTDYSEWSDCTASCGPGIKTRERTCNNPAPAGAGKDCEGETTETESCIVRECPVDGAWSSWSEFTGCTRTCGGGSQERVRKCNNPEMAHGGKECFGPAFETRNCGSTPCPIDGGWAEWSVWGACPVTCGGATQKRARSCTVPEPEHGGKQCIGAPSEEKPCGSNPCPVDCKWNPWGAYGSCSKTCGEGTQTRSRTNTPAQFGGKACDGPQTSSKNCEVKKCPIDCKWNPWGAYGSCLKTCGQGTQTRSRTNTPAQFGGKACTGPPTSSKNCEVKKCPIDCKWNAWGAYGACSKTCGQGTQTRSRSKSPVQFGGKTCTGSATSSKSCEVKKCPINGGWSSWSGYGSCNKECGNGKQTRTRTCTKPAPKFDGKKCAGSASSDRYCNSFRCVTRDNVKSDIKSKLASYKGQTNDVMAGKIQRFLNDKYTGHYFGTAVYNPVSGHDTHSMTGYASSYAAVFRENGYNAVVGWVNKKKNINKSKHSAALAAVTDHKDYKGHRAQDDVNKAWSKCKGDCVFAMVVRHGNGLRASRNSQAVTFDNYRSEQTKNWVGQRTDHKSTLIIVYGSN